MSVLFLKYLDFPVDRGFSVCVHLCMCGWWLHFRISTTVIALMFFPNNFLQCEFSLLKDPDPTQKSSPCMKKAELNLSLEMI